MGAAHAASLEEQLGNLQPMQPLATPLLKGTLEKLLMMPLEKPLLTEKQPQPCLAPR